MPARALRNNPHGDAFNDMADDGRRFAVVHQGVGTHAAGATVSARDLGPGAELPRLVSLGAIRELTQSEIDDAGGATAAAAATPAEEAGPVIRPTGGGPEVNPVKPAAPAQPAPAPAPAPTPAPAPARPADVKKP